MAHESSTSGGTQACIPPAERFPALAHLINYLDSLHSRADLPTLHRLLNGLSITRADFDSVCIFGTHGYRRNPVSRSDWYELVALTWRSSHCTPIHDHRGSSCAFRVVEGTGTEIRFSQTPSGLVCPTATNTMPAGYVCAAEDADIHQVSNMQAPGTDLITLHIYSPPIKKMNTYQFACSTGPDTDDARC